MKNISVTAYYLASAPIRGATLAWHAVRGNAPLCILFYHRVADPAANAWTIGTQDFARQMEWLRRHTHVVSMTDVQDFMRSGRNRRLAVHVSFDDGYADNCDFAIPLLLKLKIPCTYFVSLDHILTGDPFPHDRQAGTYLRPNTMDQLRRMANEGIEIGAHTRTHADLGTLSDRQQVWDELVTSAQELGEHIGRPVRFFAFPYGQPQNITASAIQIARQGGYLGVCSAYGGYNWPGSDPFLLQRIHGDPDFSRFRNWLTFDPRKSSIRPEWVLPQGLASPPGMSSELDLVGTRE